MSDCKKKLKLTKIDRRAKALRENLRKRKQQKSARELLVLMHLDTKLDYLDHHLNQNQPQDQCPDQISDQDQDQDQPDNVI